MPRSTWIRASATSTVSSRAMPDSSVANTPQGELTWGGRGFSKSARDVRITIEDDRSPAILRALLPDSTGNFRHSEINLEDRIGNNDGDFEFSKSAAAA